MIQKLTKLTAHKAVWITCYFKQDWLQRHWL